FELEPVQGGSSTSSSPMDLNSVSNEFSYIGKITPASSNASDYLNCNQISNWPRNHSLAVPIKVPHHPLNYRMAAAIVIRVVSRQSKMTVRYWMKPLTAPSGGKRWS
ncbi:hypothetical protein AVEN_189422-1, partial [Araneus ventricosus]